MRNLEREPAAGAMLILGALLGVVVLSLHPTGHDLMDADHATRMARLGVLVHALAIASVPMLFFGLLGLVRRLEGSRLAQAALVAFGLASVAVVSAAVASGFVSTVLFERMREAGGEQRDLLHGLLLLSSLFNQGFAKVYLVASSSAILLFGGAILRSRRLPAAAGIAGVAVGVALLALFLAGRLALDVHGFGLMTMAQSLWFVAVGILLWRS